VAYFVVELSGGFGLHVFGPRPATWVPERGRVVSTHNSAEAAIAARKAQEKKK
jgi:hypothetical protein